MISTEEIRDKEVINILNGKSLGFVSDIEIDLTRGRIEALVVPGQRNLFGMFAAGDEYVIKWKDIKRIGEDVILAEVQDSCNYAEQEDGFHRPHGYHISHGFNATDSEGKLSSINSSNSNNSSNFTDDSNFINGFASPNNSNTTVSR